MINESSQAERRAGADAKEAPSPFYENTRIQNQATNPKNCFTSKGNLGGRNQQHYEEAYHQHSEAFAPQLSLRCQGHKPRHRKGKGFGFAGGRLSTAAVQN